MSACLVYVTVDSKDEAESIASEVLHEHLAAGANIIGPSISMYNWEEKTETKEEYVIVFKTMHSLFPYMEQQISSMHSYKTPCVVAVPITDGNKHYLDWIATETRVKPR